MSGSPGSQAQPVTLPLKLNLPQATLKLASDYVSARRRLNLARRRSDDSDDDSTNKLKYYHGGVVNSYLEAVDPVSDLRLSTATDPIPKVRHLRTREFVEHLADVVGQKVGYMLVFTRSRHGKYTTQGDYAFDISSRRLLKLGLGREVILKGASVVPKLPVNTPDGMGIIFQAVSGNLVLNDGKLSRRCAKCLVDSPSDLKLFLLESDECKELDAKYGEKTWERIFGSFPFGVVSVVFSGDRGEHVLSLSNPTIQAALPKLKNLFALLGADPGAFSSTQITRVGGANRGDSSSEQTWLYRGNGMEPLPSVARAKNPFVSIQDFIGRVCAIVETHRIDLEEDIHRCDAERAKLKPETPAKPISSTRLSSAGNKGGQTKPKITQPQKGQPFVGKVANDPALIGPGSKKQAARQAAFAQVLEMRRSAVQAKEIPPGGQAAPDLIAQAALETGYTEEYVAFIYANNPIGSFANGNEKGNWKDYDGTPFGRWAQPAKENVVAPTDGPTRFLPHYANWGAPGSQKQLFNEFGHSCMAFQMTAKLTEKEEVDFLTGYWRNQQRKIPFPFDAAIATALKISLDKKTMGNVIILSDNQWSKNDKDVQIQKAATIRQLNLAFTQVPLNKPLLELLTRLRNTFKSNKDFLLAIAKDIQKRRSKWPAGVPTASSMRYLPLYGALLNKWKSTGKKVYSKGEILSIGKAIHAINSRPGTALSRKIRIIVKPDMAEQDYESLKGIGEGKMLSRCMGMLELLNVVRKCGKTCGPKKQRGRPESRWVLVKPKNMHRRFSSKQHNILGVSILGICFNANKRHTTKIRAIKGKKERG